VTLTFDPLTPKSIGVIYWAWPMYLQSLRTKGLWIVKLLIGNRFYLQGQCDPELWPHNPIINRAHLLAKTNVPTKIEGQGPKSYWSDTVFTYKVNVTLTFDPKMGVIYWSWTIPIPSFKCLCLDLALVL
jgi:hypothetical protein